MERQREAPAAPLPLSGVRVLSQGIVWAGPFASMTLCDLGAEVIEVETIQHLNPTRSVLRHPTPEMMAGPRGALYFGRDASPGFWNRQAYFNYGKRGHQSITLDITRPEGRERFYDLARCSDVFIENNAAGVVEKWGIDYPQLSEVNPALIMVRFPGYGLTGPYKHFKGYGANVEAVVGHTLLRGYRDSDPSLTPSIFHADPNAGAHVVLAVMLALLSREEDGRGQLIDMSQAEAVTPHLAYAWMDYAMNGRVQQHWGNRHPSMAPYGLFPCQGDDAWLALAVPTDAAFAALCREMDRPELAADPRFADVVARYHHQDDLEPLVAAWTSNHERTALMDRLQAAGVPAAPVFHQPELGENSHLAATGFWTAITHPETGTHAYPGPVAKFTHTPLAARGPAPTLGQHNEPLLCDLLGLSATDYRHLEETQVVGTEYLASAR